MRMSGLVFKEYNDSEAKSNSRQGVLYSKQAGRQIGRQRQIIENQLFKAKHFRKALFFK